MGAVLLFSNTWFGAGARWAGEYGDPILYIWHLRWMQFALTHPQNPLFTNYLNFPGGANLMWTGLYHLLAAVAVPLTATLGAITTHNLLLTLGVALSGWSAFLVARRWVPNGALLAGVVYGLGPFIAAHARAHSTLVWAFLLPVTLLLLDELLVRQRWSAWKTGALLGLVAAVQLLIAEELLAIAAVATVVGSAYLGLAQRHSVTSHWAHAVRGLAVALAIFVLLAGVPLAFQFFGPQRVHGQIQAPNLYVTDLLAPLVPSRVQVATWQGANDLSDRFIRGNTAELAGYLGVPLLIAIGVVAWTGRRDPRTRFGVVMVVAMTVLSMGPVLHVAGESQPFAMPWLGFQFLPVVQNILPARLMLVTDLFAALLVAALYQQTVSMPRGPRWFAGFLLITLSGGYLLPAASPSTPATIPAFFTHDVAQVREGSVVLVAPFVGPGIAGDAMLWQAEAGMRFRMPEGYVVEPDSSGKAIYGPPGSLLGQRLLDLQAGRGSATVSEGERAAMLAELRAWHVETIIVGPMAHRDDVVALMRELTQRPPAPDEGVLLWTI